MSKTDLKLNYNYSQPCTIFCPCKCSHCCCCCCRCPTYCHFCCCYYPCHYTYCPVCYKYLKDKYLNKPNEQNSNDNNKESPKYSSIYEKYKGEPSPQSQTFNNKLTEKPKEEEENKDTNSQKFNDYLTKVMKAENELENKKKLLANYPDFNCEDCFRLFEKCGLDSINRYDVNRGLNNLCIFPPSQDLNIFMKRNDLLKKGKIGFEEFCDIVTPFEKNIRDDVFERLPNDMNSCEANLNDNTKDCLKGLLNRIIDLEKNLNEEKKNLGEVDLEGIFDCYKNGRDLSHDEFIKYLKDNGLFNNIKEAELLFVRLDKNRDGEIQQSEIRDEITPVY